VKNKNKNNSVIFLTTLSVYLGLVLVGGATPSVLAQTKNQVITETEKPSENSSLCQNLSANAQLLFDKGFFVVPIADFLKDLDSLSKLGKFSSKFPFTQFFTYEFSIEDINGKPVTYYGKGTNDPSRNHWFDAAFYDAVNKITTQLPDKEFRVNSSSNPYKNSLAQNVKFELNQNDFVAQISFDAASADKANQLIKLYNDSFALGACGLSDSQKTFYQNTRATFENNQVFIVTRLPRGSLDELLKQNAKAENE